MYLKATGFNVTVPLVSLAAGVKSISTNVLANLVITEELATIYHKDIDVIARLAMAVSTVKKRSQIAETILALKEQCAKTSPDTTTSPAYVDPVTLELTAM